MAKIRLDKLLVERGLADSQAYAQSLIMAHKVLDANGGLLNKAGQQMRADVEIRLKEKEHPWVSRGGMKLAKAIDEYSIKPHGQIIADIGSSTGGFTDVLLTYGAAKVHAIDVGYGQLHEKLRQDERVVNREKTNARLLGKCDFPEPLDALVCDASFISLKSVLPSIMRCVKPSGWLAVLIKPQFEVDKSDVGEGGVVRDVTLHEQVCDDIAQWVKTEGWQVKGVTKSPITGPKGNVEFLLYAIKL